MSDDVRNADMELAPTFSGRFVFCDWLFPPSFSLLAFSQNFQVFLYFGPISVKTIGNLLISLMKA
jgi:hypothetical protein